MLRFNSSHEIILERDGSAWAALVRALEGPKQGSDLYIVANDAATGQALGEAQIRLQSIADDRNPPPNMTLVRARSLARQPRDVRPRSRL